MKYIFKYIKNINVISKRTFSLDKHFDICIVGGGPVGFGLASLLSSEASLKSKHVVVLESQNQKPYSHKNGYSNRTVALSPNTRSILEKCGAWDIISQHRHHPVLKMFDTMEIYDIEADILWIINQKNFTIKVWEQSSESFIAFERDHMDSNLAYIVETDILQHAITSTLHDRKNVEVKYNTTVTDLEMKTNEANLTLSDGSKLSAALLIGADGFHSRIRKLSNIKSMERNLSQRAIVSVVEFSEEIDNSGVAWQRFTKYGPIAYLPLDKHHSNLIWSTTEDNATRLMGLNEEQFLSELNREFFTDDYHSQTLDKVNEVLNSIILQLPSKLVDSDEYWKIKQLPPVGKLIVPNSRATFPLGFMHATNYVSRNVALVGDAAHRILPLAGQGVNLGFGDDECLVKCLSEGAQVGESINNYLRLQRYETERQRYVVPVVATVQVLNELYRSNFMPFVIGRAIGLKFVNTIKPLKDFFLNGATKGKLLSKNKYCENK